MSNNKLIRIVQTVIVVLVGCVSPEYAQTLFCEKPKRCKDCVFGSLRNWRGLDICLMIELKYEMTEPDPATCPEYKRKWYKFGRQR